MGIQGPTPSQPENQPINQPPPSLPQQGIPQEVTEINNVINEITQQMSQMPLPSSPPPADLPTQAGTILNNALNQLSSIQGSPSGKQIRNDLSQLDQKWQNLSPQSQQAFLQDVKAVGESTLNVLKSAAQVAVLKVELNHASSPQDKAALQLQLTDAESTLGASVNVLNNEVQQILHSPK